LVFSASLFDIQHSKGLV